MALAASTRYYAGLEPLLIWLLPAKLRKIQQDHYATALEKIHRRMSISTTRADFMSSMLGDDNLNFERMSLAEVESTTSLLLLAGSGTTGTTLCRILNCLVNNPLEMRKLQREVRVSFKQESDITFRALQNLSFLNAVISEGLRLYNPVAGSLLRMVPKGGDIVCGHFLPEGVCIDLAIPIQILWLTLLCHITDPCDS
jgi:cytochrome P450